MGPIEKEKVAPWALCILIGGLWLFPTLGRAQGSDTNENERGRQVAEQLFTESTALLESGRFAEARDKLREALQLLKEPAVAYNLAVALRGTGDTIEAIHLLEGLLTRKYGDISPEQTLEVNDFLDATREELATIIVTVCGAKDFTLRVDGDPVPGPMDC